MRASSVFIIADVDAADGLGAADELDALAVGFFGQGSGVCAGGLALDVWAAMASAAVGVLPSGGDFAVWAAMASAAVGVLPFGGDFDVWAAMASAADGPLRGVGPLGV